MVPDEVSETMPDGTVVVYASRDLHEATVEVEHEIIEDPFPSQSFFREFRQSGRMTATISTRAGNITRASGADYREALAKLFGTWSPEPTEREPGQVTGTRREITP